MSDQTTFELDLVDLGAASVETEGNPNQFVEEPANLNRI